MTDDGADYIDSNWVIDYRNAITAGRKAPDKGVVELGRTASGFMFRVNDWATYQELFVKRKKHPWGIKMPPARRSFNDPRPIPKPWPGAPNFTSTYFANDYQFRFATPNIIFLYPFSIRTFKELVVVRPHQKMINRGDGSDDLSALTGLPNDMLDKLATLVDFKDRQALIDSFDELAGMFHY